MIPVGYLIGIACAVVFVGGFIMWNNGLARAFWQSSLWDDIAPDPDDDRGSHALHAVADEIPPDELERFRNADMVCFAVRETSHLDTRFFWVHDYENGRLYAKALFIALGIRPAQLVEVFGFAPVADIDGVNHWDDLGSIPLKLGDGSYNTQPFQMLADILGKDIAVYLEPKLLGSLKQQPTHLFVVNRRCAVAS